MLIVVPLPFLAVHLHILHSDIGVVVEVVLPLLIILCSHHRTVKNGSYGSTQQCQSLNLLSSTLTIFTVSDTLLCYSNDPLLTVYTHVVWSQHWLTCSTGGPQRLWCALPAEDNKRELPT